jgi:hypothetical protein
VGIPVANGSAAPQTAPQTAPRGNFSGVWLSTYEYVSSGRGSQVFTGRHHVVLLQHGNRLTGRSLPHASSNPGSPLILDLQVAIQMLAEPTGRRMAGKWVGFGKEFDVNTGPWELRLLDTSTAKATLDAYNRPPE